MKMNIRWGLGACVAALALALNSGAASAQQKAPEAAKPAVPAKPATPAKPAAPAAKAPAKAAAPAKKAANPCTPLKDEAACTAATECAWTKETVISKGPQKGKKRAAYCHRKPVAKAPAAKAPAKAPAAKAPAAKAPAPAPTPAPPAKK